MMENKNLNYYMNLNYEFTIKKHNDDGDVYYAIEYPDLKGCISHGDTIDEAIEMGEDAKKCWLITALEKEIEIPEPNDLEAYSGNYKVRMPKSLHRELTIQAEKEKTSMNLLCVSFIAKGLGERKDVKRK